MTKRTIILTALLSMTAMLVGCKKEEGTMEKMGKKLDHAAEEVKDAGHDMSEDVKDAAKEAEKAIEGDG